MIVGRAELPTERTGQLRTVLHRDFSRQQADDFPQIRFYQEVSEFALHEMVTVPLT
jgi:hypothetical protein